MTKRLTPEQKKPTLRSEIARLQAKIDILVQQAIQSHENIVSLSDQTDFLAAAQARHAAVDTSATN
jgi:uncharacterized coiled-coil DUF342 family protein